MKKSSSKPLEDKEIKNLIKELNNGWSINLAKHLYKEFIFINFIDAIGFVNKVAELAELECHHPSIHIEWGKCSIEIWTHSISSLSIKDFSLAEKINHILDESNN